MTKEQETEVLILGAGIAGCTAAFTLSKKGVGVTLVTGAQSFQQTDSFSEQEGIAFSEGEEAYRLFKKDLELAAEGTGCPRAINQLLDAGPHLVQELLIGELGISFDQTSEGEKAWYEEEGHREARILRCGDRTGEVILTKLLEELRKNPNVQILDDHTAVQLLTLAEHSIKSGDRYKKPTCIGAYVREEKSGEVATILAKETIIATGGVGNLFLQTTSGGRGEGLALAKQAGARLLNLDAVQLYPMAFSTQGSVLRRVPDAMRLRGGDLLASNGAPFLEKWHEKGSKAPRAIVAQAAYDELMASGAKNLWLDLRRADLAWLQVKYPSLFACWNEQGIDVTNDLIPVVPAFYSCTGGVGVDRTGETTVHRLRAVGQVACTGVHGNTRLPGVSNLESLVWGTAAAEDIAKEIQKFAYYQPPLKELQHLRASDPVREQQDWQTIRQVLWNYAGASQCKRRRAQVTLRELEWEVSELIQQGEEVRALKNGISAALLLTQSEN